MKRWLGNFLLFFLLIANPCFAQGTRKVILDQDGRGPATTDQQSLLVMLQSPLVETLGITIVSGDQWRDEEVAHTLRMLELTGHHDVRVSPGAVFPICRRGIRHSSHKKSRRRFSSSAWCTSIRMR